MFGPVRMTKHRKKAQLRLRRRGVYSQGSTLGLEGARLLEIMQKRNLLATSYSYNPLSSCPSNTICMLRGPPPPSVGPPSSPPQHPSCPQPQKRPPHLCSFTSGSLSWFLQTTSPAFQQPSSILQTLPCKSLKAKPTLLATLLF